MEINRRTAQKSHKGKAGVEVSPESMTSSIDFNYNDFFVPVTTPVKVQAPIPEEQCEIFQWMLEEKRKLKPKNPLEKKQIDEDKAILKHFLRAKSIPKNPNFLSQQLMTNDGARFVPDDFGHAAARLAVAQLCDATEFHGATASALDAFADVAVRDLLDLGRIAESHADRTQCTVFDTIRSMEDLEAPRAFASAGGIREIINFFESAADKISFAQPISNFWVV
ncbi:hypothetical protein JHK85_036591 [Glycine max]|nr:hypothetical protein JHK85_036591 [Glycine max]